MKGLPNSPDIDAMVAELDADECETAITAIVGLVGTPAMEEWKSVMPEHLLDRPDAILNADGYD